MLISNNSHVRKTYFDYNIMQTESANKLQCFLKDFLEVKMGRSKCLRWKSFRDEILVL